MRKIKCLEKKLIIPENYSSKLDVFETEEAIKELKDFFERALAKKLNLKRVSAPFFVYPETGLNDNLNGIEEPVSFMVKATKRKVEVVHSLAKWKRMALHKYGFIPGTGLYTDMNAIRKDEELDNLHSIYVDQWDWEKIIEKHERTKEKLREIVKDIYKVFKETEDFIKTKYSKLKPVLPDEICFITSSELEDKYPDLSPKQREDAICKEKGAVFVEEIGHVLKSGIKHDGRAPDYDDWNLNGDILFWYSYLNSAFEVSSMGIRVDKDTLLSQLELADCLERKELEFHQSILNEVLPQTVGGGVGQSRICMFFLEKAHIGEVQVSVWPDEMVKICEKNNIFLL